MTTGNNVTSTELTGGAGFTYEDNVVAYYLTALLRQDYAAGLDGKVVSVAVQRDGHGHPMDDIVVEYQDTAGIRVLGLQAKRRLIISSAATNDDFRKIMAAALATRARVEFRINRDAYGFVAEHIADLPLRSLRRLIDGAKASTDGTDFDRRFNSDGTAGQTEKKMRAELKTLTQIESVDAEADFYRHFVALHLDGLEKGGDKRAEAISRLQEITAKDEEGTGTLLFDHLCRIARDGAGNAHKWTREGLLNQLSGTIKLQTIPNYIDDITAVSTFSTEGLQDISATIDNFHVARPALQHEIDERLDTYRLVNISGMPGCGKSAVLKQYANNAATNGPILFLKSDRIFGKGWSEFASCLGLKHSASEVLAEIGTTGTPILFIDGIDRIPPNQKGIITDLLRTIENHEYLQNWKVLATSRDHGLEPYRAWFPSSFYKETGIGNVSVTTFSDEESKTLANEKKQLNRLLFGAPAIREISRRAFFASILTQNLFDDDAAPQTEIDLINAWWHHGGHDTLPANRFPRQRALLDLAEKSLSRLGKTIPRRLLKEITFEQLGSLETDKIVREDGQVGAYSFTHDIFFEWAFFQHLIELGTEWHTALSAAGEPPLLGRVVGLLAQNSLHIPGQWTAGCRALEAASLRSQWRREWLTAPPFSPDFPDVSEEFGELLDNDEVLFEKVLVWFQAEHTLPNPYILQKAGQVENSADKIRTADLRGWPSDLQSWGRLLDWLIPRAPDFTAHLIPHVLEVFIVWQNALADCSNPRSAAIINQCNAWLIDLEHQQNGNHKFDQNDKWHVLGRKALLTLIHRLRVIILRAARSYPKPAKALYERAIDNERVREAAYSDLMTFTPIMIEIDVDLVVAIVKAALMKELPQDRLNRQENERRERNERLAALRAKPESELTDPERRVLDFPSVFPSVDPSIPSLEDIGIDRHHNYYFHASPIHEPFASLFQLKPEVALSLVCDLTNHAVLGWQQAHLLNNRQRETPLPITIDFPWGQQNFWGDWSVFSWSMSHAPHSIECAFLALSYWAFQEIDKGRPTSEVIEAILKGSECYAMLGMALMLTLETLEVSEITLPIASCQRLWHHDISRLVQEPTRDHYLFGVDHTTSRVTGTKAEWKEYLKKRKYRTREIRQLAMIFALSPDETLRERFKSALAEFPDTLPFDFEEQRSNERMITYLKECATGWSGLGDRDNYRQYPTDNDRLQISYQSPVPMTQEQEQTSANAEALLHKQKALHWAMKSLEENQPADGWILSNAVAFAREHDSDSMFNRMVDDLHSFQSSISSIAACVIAFLPHSSPDYEWGWNVMDRVMHMAEPECFSGISNPWHPKLRLIDALCRDRQTTSPRINSVEWLFQLTAHPFENVVNAAFQALFLDKDEHISWIAAQRALDLSLQHQLVIDKNGQPDNSANRATYEHSLMNVLDKITSIIDEPLTDIPTAWIKKDVRQDCSEYLSDDKQWRDPDPRLNPQFAAKIFEFFPVETWCQSDNHRELIKDALLQLVAWTSERLMPSWGKEGRRLDYQSGMYEWNSVMGHLLARAVPFFDAEWLKDKLLTPFLANRDEALYVLSTFTDSIVARYIMDAEEIPPAALEVLSDCADRLINDRQLAPSSYRGGDISGHELPTLINAMLFVSIHQNCPGSARFANGDWSEIKTIMPIVTRIMFAVGWSPYVMEQFLTLCERAGSAYPLDAFTVQVLAALRKLENARGSWASTILPARMAGIVQRLADSNYRLRPEQAQALLRILDTLVDLGDRRSAALEQAEAFRGVQTP